MKRAFPGLVLLAATFLAGSAFVILTTTALPVRILAAQQDAQKSPAKANSRGGAEAFNPAAFNPRAEYVDRSRVKVHVEFKLTAASAKRSTASAKRSTESDAARAGSQVGDGPSTELTATARVILKAQTDMSSCDLSVTFAGNLTAKQPPRFRAVEGKVKAPFGLTAAQRFVMTLPRLERGQIMNFEIPVKVSGDGRGAVIATVSRKQTVDPSLAFAEEGLGLMFVANGKIYVDPTASTYQSLIQAYRRDLTTQKQLDGKSQGSWIDQMLRFGGGEGRSAVVHHTDAPRSSETP
jgi:hypothetical protein